MGAVLPGAHDAHVRGEQFGEMWLVRLGRVNQDTAIQALDEQSRSRAQDERMHVGYDRHARRDMQSGTWLIVAAQPGHDERALRSEDLMLRKGRDDDRSLLRLAASPEPEPT